RRALRRDPCARIVDDAFMLAMHEARHHRCRTYRLARDMAEQKVLILQHAPQPGRENPLPQMTYLPPAALKDDGKLRHAAQRRVEPADAQGLVRLPQFGKRIGYQLVPFLPPEQLAKGALVLALQ